MLRHLASTVLAVGLTSASAVAQQSLDQTPTESAPPADARFQIVQSVRGLRDTFLIDRWSGRTSLLTNDKDGGLAWSEIPFDRVPKVIPASPRFQFSLSGVSAKGTYLLDTKTGESWFLVGNEPSEMKWITIAR